jgi:hypothetical protein
MSPAQHANGCDHKGKRKDEPTQTQRSSKSETKRGRGLRKSSMGKSDGGDEPDMRATLTNDRGIWEIRGVLKISRLLRECPESRINERDSVDVAKGGVGRSRHVVNYSPGKIARAIGVLRPFNLGTNYKVRRNLLCRSFSCVRKVARY